MYSVIYRMNKLANFIGKERDEYKLKASICSGVTHKNNPSLQELFDVNTNHSLMLSVNEIKTSLSFLAKDLKLSEANSYDAFAEKCSVVIYFLVHINMHNFRPTLECMESKELNAAYDNLLADIHKRLLLIQQHTYNIDNFRKYRRQIADLLFAEREGKSVSKCLSDTEKFLQEYIFQDNSNITLCEMLSWWKDYVNVLFCLLDDFYSSSGFSFLHTMIIYLRKWSRVTHFKVILSQLYIQKLLGDDFGRLSLQELRNINEILKIWSNISKQLKIIQLNLLTQLDSAKTDIHRETSLSDNSSDLLGEQFESPKTNLGTIFDLSFFDSFFFYDQSHEYTLDTRRHSSSSLQSHKPKSALKKSGDTSIIPEKVNISKETETILWEPVYTMNKSLMKCLIRATLQTLQDYASQLQLGCNPTAIDIMNSSKKDSNQCGNNLNIEYYNCLNILLQTPVFATSVHGQLFNPADLCFSDFWYHKNQNILDEQFNPSFTTQNMLCSWNGAVGTGAGLPMPKIYISKSLQAFIAFNLEILLPMILNLLQIDVDEQQSKSQSNNRENSNNNSEKFDDDLNNREYTDNLNDDSLRLLISEVINVLLTILNGHGLNKSFNVDITDNSATENNENKNDTMEFVGLTAQLSTITLSVDWDLSGIEKLALCISDCLSLRALCSLLASIFDRENESPVKSFKFNGQHNVTSLFFGCAKEYDVSIRLLSEQITDISLVYYYNIGFTTEEDLNYLNKIKLLLLPDQFKLQSNQSILGAQSDIKHLSKPIQSIWCILSNIWSILIQTCPGGLSRQIMAHVSSKLLESAVQQLDVSKINSGLDFSMQFRDELWLTLAIAKFALYRSAESISEVLGVGNLSVELNTIHTTGLLTTQMLLSCYTPRHLWEKLHEKGFYSYMVENTNKTFDFSLSNWLAIVDSTRFHDIPIHLMKENPRQTELEIEVELFSVSGHFDPVRIISLLTSWNYKLSLLILEALYANQSTDILTDKEKLVAKQLFISILRILDAVPEYTDFLGKVVELVIIPGSEKCKLLSRTLLDHKEWPLWFDALVQLLAEPLERIWIRFKELKDQRLEEDESFHDYELVDKLNENPTNILNNYTPKRRVYWDRLFPSGYMPCGCSLPEPFSFNNIKQSHICTSPITDRNRDSNNNNNNNNNNSGNTNISTNSSTKHQLKITSKFELEEEIGNYVNYYQKCGCSQEVWFELACDIIRLPVMNCSTGLQLALTKINDYFITIIENQLVEYSEQININNNNLINGQHFAIHLVILFLNYRIHEEIKIKTLNNEYKTQQQSTIEQLQYSILLEYLKSLLNVNDENEDIYACKKRVRSFLTERNNDVNDSELFIPGNSSRIFKNIQNLRFVQHKALPDLFFMHEFLHANTTWINELIRNERQCYKTPMHNKPYFQLDKLFIPNVGIKLIDSIEEINWEKIHSINVGLQEL
ncbi:hypothetical protein MS3_00007428 [Schistosoma haematobium]|uniref:Uncharacterized protein n=3 Tax=Schistosoma haematobium TaxID=6185 RepID=A0A922IME2_SCHHA|nr:hypothetical protein MS3_00007428 [Schistosoma haematobium]KAH9582793.1 hypothetical protein MS3_00007428 [Schistosoma haematobium]